MMGGNALGAVTERKLAGEYRAIMAFALQKLKLIFPTAVLSEVKSYRSKESFGDGDILIVKDNLPENFIQQIHHTFEPMRMMLNVLGAPPVTYEQDEIVPDNSPDCMTVSFEYCNLQIDLILVAAEEYESACCYYAYNDLGNFMGRVASKMGFKYGWDGLWYVYTNNVNGSEKVLVSRNSRAIFAFLGYYYEDWLEGFDTLEDVFAFASSTPYFNRKLYLFENRNHKDRARDTKRKSYNAFLEWVENKPHLDKFEWPNKNALDKLGIANLTREPIPWLHRAQREFDGFAKRLELAQTAENQRLRLRAVWNGGFIKRMTGLQDAELGAFMRYCANSHNEQVDAEPFDVWAVNQSQYTVETFIFKHHQQWLAKQSTT